MIRVLRSSASSLAALALLAGVPWLLTATIGNPLDRLPDLLAGDVNDHVVLAALAAVVWLAWAQFAVAFAVELVSAVRRTPMPARIPGVFAGQQGLARALVNGALLLLPITVATVVPAAQALAMTAPTTRRRRGHRTGAGTSRWSGCRGRPRRRSPTRDRHPDRRRCPHLVGPGRRAPRRRRRVAGAVGPQPGPGPGRRHRADHRAERAAARLDRSRPRHHRRHRVPRPPHRDRSTGGPR